MAPGRSLHFQDFRPMAFTHAFYEYRVLLRKTKAHMAVMICCCCQYTEIAPAILSGVPLHAEVIIVILINFILRFDVMWCTSCSLERNMVSFLFYIIIIKTTVSAYTTTRKMLQHSSLNCSNPRPPPLLSVQALSSRSTMLDFFFTTCIPRKLPLTQKQTLLVLTGLHPVTIHAI